jgi:hypothetical protein
MDMVMTLVWYPWTEGQGGPAGTRGEYRTLDLELRGASWPRLPNVGETIFFDDGGSASIEAVGWKLDGTAYLYLGNRYEKKGEQLPTWLGRGFRERPGQTAPNEPTVPATSAPAGPPVGGPPYAGAGEPQPTIVSERQQPPGYSAT